MKTSKTYRKNSSSEEEIKDKESKHNNLLARQFNNKDIFSHNGISQEYYSYLLKTLHEKEKPTKKIIIAESPDKRSLGYGLNDNMNVDKNQKTIAKKGLLYLLNNLSGGTFCSAIETYFQQIKEDKKAELELKQIDPNDNINNSNNNNRDIIKDNNKTVTSFNQGNDNSFTPKVKKLRNDLVDRETNFVNMFKKRNENSNNNDKEDEVIGIKDFLEDKEKKKLQQQNSTKGITMTNNNANAKAVVFRFNKEKQARNVLNLKEGKIKKKKKKKIQVNNSNENEYDFDSQNMFGKKTTYNVESEDSSL